MTEVPNRAHDPRRKVGSYYVTVRPNEHTGDTEALVEAGETLHNAGETTTGRSNIGVGGQNSVIGYTNYTPPKYVHDYVTKRLPESIAVFDLDDPTNKNPGVPKDTMDEITITKMPTRKKPIKWPTHRR